MEQLEWAVLESLSDETLLELWNAWQALAKCDNYEVGSPVNVALRVAAEHGRNEAFGRGLVQNRGRQSSVSK